MKTLDEVIKAMLICKNEDIDRTCKGCHMPDTEMCINELMTDALHYLKILKAKSEEPAIGEPPDYISLDFHRLAEMIGEPVYFKERGCKGHWEIITAVRKNLDGEDYAIRGNDRWQRIGDCIYRTKEGADR
jgi:hypothetical protein